MKIPAPLSLVPMKAAKTHQVRFGETKKTESAKPKRHLSIKGILVSTFFIANIISFGLIFQELFKDDNDLKQRSENQSMFLTHIKLISTLKKESRDLKEYSSAFLDALENLYWASNGRKLPSQWWSNKLTYQYQGVLGALIEDDALIQEPSAPLSKQELDNLYNRYVQRPDTVKTFAIRKFGLAKILKQGYIQIDEKVEQAYEQYRQSGQGKQNPISKDEFALFADTYRFFRAIQQMPHPPEATPELEAIYNQYLERVIAKHAQNPNLPELKPYLQNARVEAQKQFTDLQKERIWTMSKDFGHMGYQVLLMFGFTHLFIYLENSRNTKSQDASPEAPQDPALKEES